MTVLEIYGGKTVVLRQPRIIATNSFGNKKDDDLFEMTDDAE